MCMDRAYVRMTHRLNRSNVSLSVPKDPSAFFGEHGRTFPCFTHSILLRWDRRWWWRKKTPLRQALHHRRGCWPTPWLSIQIEDCPRTHDPPSDPDSESADEKGQNNRIKWKYSCFYPNIILTRHPQKANYIITPHVCVRCCVCLDKVYK